MAPRRPRPIPNICSTPHFGDDEGVHLGWESGLSTTPPSFVGNNVPVSPNGVEPTNVASPTAIQPTQPKILLSIDDER